MKYRIRINNVAHDDVHNAAIRRFDDVPQIALQVLNIEQNATYPDQYTVTVDISRALTTRERADVAVIIE